MTPISAWEASYEDFLLLPEKVKRRAEPLMTSIASSLEGMSWEDMRYLYHTGVDQIRTALIFLLGDEFSEARSYTITNAIFYMAASMNKRAREYFD